MDVIKSVIKQEGNMEHNDIDNMIEVEVLEFMELWFRENYENPAENTPFDSGEGGYIYIWGGPYDAYEVLDQEFGDVVDYELIKQLADDLCDEAYVWARIPKAEEIDSEFYNTISLNYQALYTFGEAIDNIRQLMQISINTNLQNAMNNNLYASVITTLETYLSDTFINAVLGDNAYIRRFVETTPSFKEESLKYSDLYKTMDELPIKVKEYLINFIWHNMPKVRNMYRDTLGIEMGNISDLIKSINIRHDIIHRNGKNKDGNINVISQMDITNLISNVEIVCNIIDNQINNVTVDSDIEI